jgi:hypothetical protein
MINIESFPPFVDEATHIQFGRNVAEIGPLMHANEGRQLYVWWLMLFQAGASAAFYVSRVASLLVVMVGSAAFLGLGRLFSGSWGMICSTIVLVLSPYHHFFERLALADPSSSALAIVGVYFSARLVRRISIYDAILAGLSLFLAFGFKVSALPYLVAPLVAVLTLKSTERSWRHYFKWGSASLTTGIFLAIVWVLILAGRGQNPVFHLLRGTADGSDVARSILHRIPINISNNIDNLNGFFEPALLFVLFATLMLLVWRKHLFLPTLVLVPWTIFWLNSRPDTRHLMIPVTLLLLASAAYVGKWVANRQRGLQFMVTGALAIVSLLLWLPFAVNGPQYELAESDFRQYVASEGSGFGLDALAGFLRAQQAERVYGLMANCRSLELLLLHEVPIICPDMNPNGSSVPDLTSLVHEMRKEDYLVVVESIHYVPQTIPGKLIFELDRPYGGPGFRILDIEP